MKVEYRILKVTKCGKITYKPQYRKVFFGFIPLQWNYFEKYKNYLLFKVIVKSELSEAQEIINSDIRDRAEEKITIIKVK